MTSSDVWTIKAALDWTEGYLARKGDGNPRLSAEWLLSEATGKRRIELYVNFDQPLSLEERDVLRGYVTRRGKGEPLQYITGEVAFRHINVKVRPGVLIPRPETEVLVSEVLSLLPAAPRPRARDDADAAAPEVLAAFRREAAGEEGSPEQAGALADPASDEAASLEAQAPAGGPTELLVADLCTGSGCIACSIAHEHPCARVVATDISDVAVALARDNVDALGLGDRVEVVQCSLGEGVDDALLGALDAVVSNPPYVPTAVLADIPREVAHFEPALALDGGNDGLDLFRPLATWAMTALKPGGVLACELHEGHMDAAAGIARAAGFSDVRIASDLTGRPRIVTARKPS